MLVQERERVYERLEHALALLALPEDKLWPRVRGVCDVKVG
jgi:hypothetical protein